MIDRARLAEILAGFEDTRVLVVGDYFLDKYLDIDRSLAEISLETGLEAHQVVRVRCSPGAAGTVVSNLRALKVQVSALGAIGDDGEGYELLRGLQSQGVETAPLLRLGDYYTPTYTKPMMHEADGRIHELSRLDIKNRSPLATSLEDALIERLNDLVPGAQGVIIADQVPRAQLRRAYRPGTRRAHRAGGPASGGGDGRGFTHAYRRVPEHRAQAQRARGSAGHRSAIQRRDLTRHG